MCGGGAICFVERMFKSIAFHKQSTGSYKMVLILKTRQEYYILFI